DSEPGPSESSTASIASMAVQMARRKAYEGLEGPAKGAKKQDGVLDTVVSAATKVASFPGSIVGSILPGDAEFVPRPLSERSTILLLILAHNCRSGIEASSLPAANPFRFALTKLADVENPLSMLPAQENQGEALVYQPLPVKFKGIFSALTQLC